MTSTYPHLESNSSGNKLFSWNISHLQWIPLQMLFKLSSVVKMLVMTSKTESAKEYKIIELFRLEKTWKSENLCSLDNTCIYICLFIWLYLYLRLYPSLYLYHVLHLLHFTVSSISSINIGSKMLKYYFYFSKPENLFF